MKANTAAPAVAIVVVDTVNFVFTAAVAAVVVVWLRLFL
jgi:hypothetical protein